MAGCRAAGRFLTVSKTPEQRIAALEKLVERQDAALDKAYDRIRFLMRRTEMLREAVPHVYFDEESWSE